jgi:3-oxoacyl-[acyl-carrier-protein] synthase II
MTSADGLRRVVITGLGTINPIGRDVPAFWDALTEGRSGTRPITHFDVGDYDVRIAAEVDLPDNVAEYFSNRKYAKRFDRYAVFAHLAASQALADSGLDAKAEPQRIGAIIGTGDAGLETQENQIERMLQRGMNRVSSYYVTSHIPNMGPALFALEHGLQGPNFAVSSACATSNHAIGTAADMIRLGRADVMFAGGAEAVITRMSIAGFGNIMALSERNDDPATASRPFDKDRDGFVIGEGSGIVCLEELGHAKARGAKIYAEVRGFGASCDAHDLVATEPEGRGAVAAMRQALDEARLNADDIGLINAHGTSTPVGDLAESRAIEAVFGPRGGNAVVHSTKSMTGHLIGAAGGTELVAALMATERGVIHPTINQFERDPEITITIVENEPMERRVDHILSNSFGFGGQNAALVVSRYAGD